MKSDLLTTDLSSTVMPFDLKQLPQSSADGVFFTSSSFHRHLEIGYDFIDLMTYGASKDCCCVPVRRAIVGLGRRTMCEFRMKPEKVKLFTNIHTKLVIAYNDGAPSVFVGSANFVAPTLVDLMVMITNKYQVNHLLSYYETFWNKPTKHKTK